MWPSTTAALPSVYFMFSICGITQGGRGDDPSSELVQTRMVSFHVAKNEDEALQ